MSENDTRDKIVEVARKLVKNFNEKEGCGFACRDCRLSSYSVNVCNLLGSLRTAIGNSDEVATENMTFSEALAAMIHRKVDMSYNDDPGHVFYFDGGAFINKTIGAPVHFRRFAHMATTWRIVPKAQELPLVDFGEAFTALRSEGRKVRSQYAKRGSYVYMRGERYYMHSSEGDEEITTFTIDHIDMKWQILPDEEEGHE